MLLADLEMKVVFQHLKEILAVTAEEIILAVAAEELVKLELMEIVINLEDLVVMEQQTILVEVLCNTLEAVAEELTIQVVDQMFLAETVAAETVVSVVLKEIMEQMEKAAAEAAALVVVQLDKEKLEETV